MESVMWAFKQLWDKGLIYQSNRVLPYSWGAETPLSNHEIRLDDATRPRQDPAITVAFELDDPSGIPSSGDSDADQKVSILAWTTTPWTLPSNLALSVGPDLQYAVMRDADGSRYVLSEAVVESYERQLRHATHVGTISGSDLVGRTYVPLFDFFADMAEVDPQKPHHGENRAFVILEGDFIDTSKAPALCIWRPGSVRTTNVWQPKRVSARWYRSTIPGVSPKKSPPGRASTCSKPTPASSNNCATQVFWCVHDSYTHNYPHCWRTDTPIIYKAMPSWYVKVTDIRDRLLETNQEINWVPSHIRDGRFGMWLEGARDWSISRTDSGVRPSLCGSATIPIFPAPMYTAALTS